MSKLKILAIILLVAAAGFSAWLIYGSRQPETIPAKITQKIEQKIDDVKQQSRAGQQDVLLDVPFSPQAPFADWSDQRQQDGCEEASIIMAIRWVRGQSLTRQEALDEILALSKYEQEHFGTFHDTSAADTLKLMQDYYNYDKGRVEYAIDVEDIKQELMDGNLVLVPADGRKLGNPNFRGDGPPRHMVVIRGFDEKARQFITNDPGTRKGEGYRYDYEVLLKSILNYPTGHKDPVIDDSTVMIVVNK